MAIVVVCPNCLTTFQVKDKYAGKQGPCPKCRSVIKVPEFDETLPAKSDASEKEADEAKVKRRVAIEPIERTSAKIPNWLMAAAAGGSIAAIIVAFTLRNSDWESISPRRGCDCFGAAAGIGWLFDSSRRRVGIVSRPDTLAARGHLFGGVRCALGCDLVSQILPHRGC
jgi:hypothetical protein